MYYKFNFTFVIKKKKYAILYHSTLTSPGRWYPASVYNHNSTMWRITKMNIAQKPSRKEMSYLTISHQLVVVFFIFTSTTITYEYLKHVNGALLSVDVWKCKATNRSFQAIVSSNPKQGYNRAAGWNKVLMPHLIKATYIHLLSSSLNSILFLRVVCKKILGFLIKRGMTNTKQFY